MTAACTHPSDSVETLDVTSHRGNVTIVKWCSDCGALRLRKDVDDLFNCDRAPWCDWQLPDGVRP